MGGIDVRLPVPAGYAEAPAVLRQSAAYGFNPPENIFVAFNQRGDKAQSTKAALSLLRNRRVYLVTARPEFMKEYVDQSFFSALRRDLQRLHGNFSPERLQQFRVLTNSYYAKDDVFTHSLGVYSANRYSMSIVRINRQPSSKNSGAVPAFTPGYKQAALVELDARLVLTAWDKLYFSQAYHQVSIQNVVMLNGRYFNVYFNAPLSDEADIYASMLENKMYMDDLVAAASAGQLGQENMNTRDGHPTMGALPQNRERARTSPASGS